MDRSGRTFLQACLGTAMPFVMAGAGQTRHIHVKVQAPNNPIPTMQLYFKAVRSED